MSVFSKDNRKRSKHKSATHTMIDYPRRLRRQLEMPIDQPIEELPTNVQEEHAAERQKRNLKVFGIDMQGYKVSEERSCNLCVIISGGEEKERQYFSVILANPMLFPRLKLSFVSGTDQLHYLIQHAASQKRFVTEALENSDIDQMHGDTIAIVTDVDHFTSDILQCIPKCKKHGYDLIISNPCFEVWLYYCYFSKFPDNFQVTKPEKISSDLKKYISRLDPVPDPIKAICQVRTAIVNAKGNYSEDKSGFPVPFSTQMYQLMEKILPYIEDGVDQLLNEK